MDTIAKLRASSGLLTVRQTAQLLGLHQMTLYSWISKGHVPFVRIGRNVRFDGVRLADWLEKRSLQ